MSIEATEATTSTSPGAALAGGGGDARPGRGDQRDAPVVSRSLTRQAWVDTLASKGARVGLAWLGLLAFFAVFGPFLASSHPVLMKAGGKWSSPMLSYLTWADVLWVIAAMTAIVLAVARKFDFGRSVLVLLGVVIVCAGPCYWLVPAKENVTYERYREMTSAGQIEKAFYAPVRFSA